MANFTALKTAINNAIKTNGNEEITGAILQAILDAMVETLGDSAITDLENAITTEVTNRENAVGDVADDLAAEVQARQALDYNVNNRINAEEYNRQNADAALSQTMSQGFQTLGSQMTALNAAISALNAAYQNGYLYGGIATPSSSPSNNKCFYIALQGGTYTNFGGVGVVEGINIIKNDSGWKVEHIYDQTTLLNEFYLLRQQVIRALASYEPIVVQGDVTNAPDEEDLTSNAKHLLKFKDRDYSPLNFSGLGMKILRKNILPLNDSVAFNGFLEGVTAEETLAGSPELIFWDRMNTRFVGIKDGVYYLDWTDSDNYVPVSTSLVYMYNGTPYQWTGSDLIVDETEVPNLVNCLTQDMINEANTIYIIRYNYTLKEDITIPANCVLQFDGGSISGAYTITGANTGIQAGLVKIFSTEVTLAGSWDILESYPEWFGGGTAESDNSVAINKALSVFNTVKLGNGSYTITSPILISSNQKLFGSSKFKTKIVKNSSFSPDNAVIKCSGSFIAISDLTIHSNGYYTDYGILFTADVSQSVFNNINIYQAKYGLYIDNHAFWAIHMYDMEINPNSNYLSTNEHSYGYSSCTCFYLNCNNGGGSGVQMDNIWARDCSSGFYLKNIECLLLNNCYLDNCYGNGYNINGSTGTLNNIKIENSDTSQGIYFGTARIVLNYYRHYNLRPKGTEATMIRCDGSKITMNQCNLENWVVPSDSTTDKFGLLPNDGSHVVCIGCTFPTNINSFQPLSNGSRILYIDDNRISSNYANGINSTLSLKARHSGTSAVRPDNLLSDKDKGFSYFDETLKSLLLWDGTEFVDSINRVQKYRGGSHSLNSAIEPGFYVISECSDAPTDAYREGVLLVLCSKSAWSRAAQIYLPLGGGADWEDGFYLRTMLTEGSAPTEFSGTWKFIKYSYKKTFGTTSQRPLGYGATGGTLKPNFDIGFKYFDTTLGKPIYVSAIANDGTVTWVDATGAAV